MSQQTQACESAKKSCGFFHMFFHKLGAVCYCVTDRENGLPTQRVPDEEKILTLCQWWLLQKVDCRFPVRRGTEDREASRGHHRDFGHNHLLNPKESFVQLQLPQVHLASRNTPRQVSDLFLYDLYGF